MASMIPKTYWLRSTIFNVVFYTYTLLGCILAIPFLLLSPSAFVNIVVKTWCKGVHVLERVILGLNYEIKGIEHLPESGPYIIAAKHQSPYETLKLHLLFDMPSIILKKELLSIPLFGWYLRKADLIAIDRSSKDAAMQSIQDGSKRAKSQNRPIVIFPQGTRVNVDETTTDKPYKFGIVRIQEATELPIIPMALNCGLFWSRSGWCKYPGTTVFEFLPPIPENMERADMMRDLKNDLEHASNRLRDEELAKRSS
jgi:1-acyl-sn-glycerol-3-phosphate acyltransferase